ncbi:DNA-binding protein [Salinisphaera sp. LB1]|uniref:DNA-binding protein n=1 Tax=Salinisphaera sp. LB1 TaxID=2183911 RepID=UPI000D708470|nr:DNA-binding protein [Salinisphaera sp. LB1]
MPRSTVTYAEVKATADALSADGKLPIVARVLDRAGLPPGTSTIVHRHLKTWRDAQPPVERPAPRSSDDLSAAAQEAPDESAEGGDAIEIERLARELDGVQQRISELETSLGEARNRTVAAQVTALEALLEARDHTIAALRSDLRAVRAERDEARQALGEAKEPREAR